MMWPGSRPTLCERLTDPRKLADRHYTAEPKLDGQRAMCSVTPIVQCLLDSR